jgi:hypothetical protein
MKRLVGTLIMAVLLYFDVGGLWAVVRVISCCSEEKVNGNYVRSERIFHEVYERAQHVHMRIIKYLLQPD